MQTMFDDYDPDEHGDGYRNDYERASAWELIERPLLREDSLANSLTCQGKFVVCHSWPRYSRVHDAYLGEEIKVRGVYNTQAEAEETLAEEREALGGDDESSVFIWRFTPALPLPIPAPPVQDEPDEIPF